MCFCFCASISVGSFFFLFSLYSSVASIYLVGLFPVTAACGNDDQHFTMKMAYKHPNYITTAFEMKFWSKRRPRRPPTWTQNEIKTRKSNQEQEIKIKLREGEKIPSKDIHLKWWKPHQNTEKLKWHARISSSARRSVFSNQVRIKYRNAYCIWNESKSNWYISHSPSITLYGLCVKRHRNVWLFV